MAALFVTDIGGGSLEICPDDKNRLFLGVIVKECDLSCALATALCITRMTDVGFPDPEVGSRVSIHEFCVKFNYLARLSLQTCAEA